ncbi:MAG: hypothetical protein KKA73_08840 [Chloroflexi bacterium]|nr:hypothetical protein [Chloroflexota bacterium]MBU1747783.1 hypothetical protein [Chloroflexota bacterium]MBU1879813.1 hypothetical protein [Chloroflexota bacterium]
MIGDIDRLFDNLWFVVGEMPEDLNKKPDIANVLVYCAGDRLYLMDSGVGLQMRAGIERALQEAGTARSFTLLNSHAHADHICHNDLIHTVPAAEKHHYLAEPGLEMLDPCAYFGQLFHQMSEYYDPLTGYQAYRLKYRLAGLLRDTLALFVGQERAMTMLMPNVFKKFEPIHPSRETIQPYETLLKRELRVGNVTWSGWVLGDDAVWVLEERGHSPDEVLFYVPEHRLLHTADLTFELFPTWPDSNSQVTREALHKCLAMARAGQVQVLTDSHHHQVYRGQSDIVAFLDTLLSDHERFREVLAQVMDEQDGLTVGQVYARVRERDDPVVRKYLACEFPHTPPSLQAVIVASLLEMGYQARGPQRRKRFFRPGSDQGGWNVARKQIEAA